MSERCGRQLQVAVAALAGLYLAVFGPGVIASVRAAVSGDSATDLSAWSARTAAIEWDIFSALVVVVVLRWLTRHASDVTARMGLQWRTARPIPGGTLSAATTFVAVAALSAAAGDRVVAAWHLPHAGYPGLGRGAGELVLGVFAAGSAGVTEELVLLALAVAVVEQLCRGNRWTSPVAITVLLALRWPVHVYYLGGSIFVLFWMPAAYLVFRWAGSVWPLVVGHVLYDVIALADHAYPDAGLGEVLWPVSALGVAVAIVSAWQCRAVRPDRSTGPTDSSALSARLSR